MSGLVFEGDVIYSTGEYLPAPYINKVFVDETEITIENFIFLDDFNDVDLADSNGNISNSREIYKQQASGLKYYFLILNDYPFDPQNIYEKLIDKSENPFILYNLYAKFASDGFLPEGVMELKEATPFLSLGVVDLGTPLQIHTPLATPSKDFFDEEGNRVTAYKYDTSVGIEEGINSFYVFAFSSTFDYYSDSEILDEDTFNRTLFDLQISDMSYEKVYENGELALKDALRFYDANDNLYEKIPLQAVDKSVYKIDLVSHDYIKENIEDLLSEYSAQYNSETGNDELKNIMNAIYATLETYYEDYDIVPRLDVIRKTFPDKTPVSTVGKLYKRFSKRIYNINKSIASAEELFKRITYNSKIVDLRSIQVDGTAAPSYDADSIPDDEYIYTDWKAVRINPGGELQVVFGHFFFDYEKALRTRTDISRVLDVNKLEEFGYHVPYENYAIDSVNISRKDGTTTDAERGFGLGFGSSPENTVLNMSSIYDISLKYPYVNVVVFEASTDEGYVIKRLSGAGSTNIEAFASTPYSDSDPIDAEGYVTSLLNRAYTPIYDDVSDIENYRLMCYEFLEYQLKEDTSDYTVTVNLVDTTSELISALSESAYAAYEAIGEYYETTQEECVFNSDLGRFNEFFAEGAMAAYLGSPQTAPWYIAPVVYLMQLDLFFNTSFDGDLESIENEAKNITARINPINGTKDAIEQFYTDFGDLIDKVYGSTGIMSDYSSWPTTSEDTITAVLAMPASQDVIFEVDSEDVDVVTADRTSSRFSEDVTVAVDATSYQELDESNLTYYGHIYRATIPFSSLTHTPTEMIQATTVDGDPVTPSLDTENSEITLRYISGLTLGFEMPETTLTFTVGYFYDT